MTGKYREAELERNRAELKPNLGVQNTIAQSISTAVGGSGGFYNISYIHNAL